MTMDELTIFSRLIIWAIPVVFAITVHEVAHGTVANHFGDDTARCMDRLSLNPIRHIDPVGSLLIPVILLWFSGFIFGWAKPVPVNKSNLANPRRDMIFVALAGPLSNLLMSLLWACLMKLGYTLLPSLPSLGIAFIYIGSAGVFINTAIMMLNLLPIPPLDGGRILAGLLPERFGRWLNWIEPLGLPILLVLIFTGLGSKLIWPMMVVGMAVATYVVDVPVELFINSLWILLGKTDYVE